MYQIHKKYGKMLKYFNKMTAIAFEIFLKQLTGKQLLLLHDNCSKVRYFRRLVDRGHEVSSSILEEIIPDILWKPFEC